MMTASNVASTTNGRVLRSSCDRCATPAAPGVPPGRLLTVESLAQLLSVEVSFVRRLVLHRRIPYVKVGPYVRFVAGDVARWIESHRIERASTAAGRGGRPR